MLPLLRFSRSLQSSIAPDPSMMESDEIKIISFEDLKSYTRNFSEENFIENCQFGKVYRGKIGQREVTVKIWRLPALYTCHQEDNLRRLIEELHLHGDSRLMSHPNVAKLIEYCEPFCDATDKEKFGVVYDFKSLNTLLHFVQQDDFTWLQRIRVAYQLACLLSFLHNPTITQQPYFDHLPYMVINLNLAHIMLDQDYNPILYDFGMLSGGVLPDKNSIPKWDLGFAGYVRFPRVNTSGYYVWLPENDVFSFAMILIGLITKKVFIAEDYIDKEHEKSIIDPPYREYIIADPPYLDIWAFDEYEKQKLSFGEDKVSLVDKCFGQDPDFEPSDAVKIIELLMSCRDVDYHRIALSEKIVEEFDKLKVMQKHPKTLGVKQSEDMLRCSSHYEALEIMEEGASNYEIKVLKKELS